MLSRNEQKVIDAEHAKNPEPGDYWSEHLVGVCVVLVVDDNFVTYCKTRKEVSPAHWTWDLSRQLTTTIEEFEKWLSYDSIEGYWATCKPVHMLWAVEEASKNTITHNCITVVITQTDQKGIKRSLDIQFPNLSNELADKLDKEIEALALESMRAAADAPTEISCTSYDRT